jgi:hypothetical protein
MAAKVAVFELLAEQEPQVTTTQHRHDCRSRAQAGAVCRQHQHVVATEELDIVFTELGPLGIVLDFRQEYIRWETLVVAAHAKERHMRNGDEILRVGGKAVPEDVSGQALKSLLVGVGHTRPCTIRVRRASRAAIGRRIAAKEKARQDAGKSAVLAMNCCGVFSVCGRNGALVCALLSHHVCAVNAMCRGAPLASGIMRALSLI